MFNAMTLLIGWIDSLDVFGFWFSVTFGMSVALTFCVMSVISEEKKSCYKVSKGFHFAAGKYKGTWNDLILLCFSMEDSLIRT